MIDDALTHGMLEHERHSFSIHSSITFKGKTMEQWLQDCKIPDLESVETLSEQEELNKQYINKCELVMTNLAYARSDFMYIKMKYKNALINAQEGIKSEIATWNAENPNSKSRRVPGAETLEGSAKARVMDIYNAYYISQIFKEFWETIYEKINMVNFRLTGLNSLKNASYKSMNY